MKANPGYKWDPTTNHHVTAQTSPVANRRKPWALPQTLGEIH